MNAAERLQQIRAEKAAQQGGVGTTAPAKTATQRLAEIRAEKAAKSGGMSAPPPKKDALDIASDVGAFLFPGTKQVGESVAKAGINIGNLVTGGPAKFQKRLDEDPSLRTDVPRLAGSYLASGATALSAGVGGAGSLASKALKFGSLGALAGGGDTYGKGGTIEDTAKSAAGTGAVGAAIPLVGGALNKVGTYLTEKAPKQLVNYSLRVPAKQASKKINEAILSRNLGGKSLPKIITTAADEIDEMEKLIQSKLTDKTLTSMQSFTDEVANTLNKKIGSGVDGQSLRARIAQFVPDHANIVSKKVISEKEANILRRAIDNNLKDATFMGKELTNEQRAIKAFADSLRKLVKGRTSTQLEFRRQAEAIGIKKLATSAQEKLETQGRPGFLDIASGGIGLGLSAGNPWVAGGAIGLQRLIRNPQIQGGIGQTLRKSKSLGPLLGGLGQIGGKIIVNSSASTK